MLFWSFALFSFINKIQQLNTSMSFYSSRRAIELSLSRRLQEDRELQYLKAVEIQRLAQARQLQARELRQIDRLRQDQEFQRYQILKNAELQKQEDELVKERLYRAEKQRQYEVLVEAEKRSRILREEQIEAQKRILEQEQRKKSEILAASRRAELDRQTKIKEDADRENNYVLEEQKNQEKLEKELHQILLQIGGIYDARDERKKIELEELQKLDQQIFKIRQDLRGSKVRQMALQQDLLNISKLII